MGKIIETKIDRFDGGIATDLRAGASNQFAITQHFNNHLTPGRLIPYRDHIADETGQNPKDYLIQKLTPGYRTIGGVVTAVLWGLGEVGGAATIHRHSGIPETAGWQTTVEDTAASTSLNEFLFYYRGGLYAPLANLNIYRYNTATLAGNSTFMSWGSVPTAKPVHHPSDDIAYFFEANAVHKVDNATATQDVLTLPVDSIITAACAYGDYLAIATVPRDRGIYSMPNTVYLWDRDSSLATVSHKINFGVGKIIHLACLDNTLIAVVDRFIGVPDYSGSSELVILGANTSTGSATVLNRIVTTNTANTISNYKDDVVQDNILYFPIRIKTFPNDTVRVGICSVNSRGAVTFELVEEDLTISSSSLITSIARVAGSWFIAHSGDGSIQKTNTSASYTYTSIYESLIFNNGDSSITKKLIGATVMTVPLPTSGQVVLKYRKDAETSWTTIYTNTTDDSISQSAINYSSGTNLPEFKEIQFRIESTGGAEITGLKFKAEVIDKDLY